MKINKNTLPALAALPLVSVSSVLSDIVGVERVNPEPAESNGWLGWLIAGAAVIAAAVLTVIVVRARKKAAEKQSEREERN